MNSKDLDKKAKFVEILLVEDELPDVTLIKLSFKNAKIANHLHVAGDGIEAMNFLKKVGAFAEAPTPDLILLDLNMPRKNGMQVLEELKSDPQLKTIPVVIMTSSDSEEEVIKSYKLHANCYIRKPIEISELEKIVAVIETFWFTIVTLPPHK